MQDHQGLTTRRLLGSPVPGETAANSLLLLLLRESLTALPGILDRARGPLGPSECDSSSAGTPQAGS